MPDELHRLHHKRRSSRFVQFLKACWGELRIAVGLVLGIFLLFEQMNIRGTLMGWAIATGNLSLNLVVRLIDSLMGFSARLGLSELITVPMLIDVMILLAWRMRWRLRNTPALIDLYCPRYGCSLHREHRHFFDRVASIFIPVRRCRCTNRDCGWLGMRVSTYSGRGRPRPAPQ